MGTDRPDESFASLFEQSQKSLGAPKARGPRVGDTLSVAVIQVGRDAVFVEVDGRRQGFIEAGDVQDREGNVALKVGDVVKARVVRVDDQGVQLRPTVEAAVATGAAVSLGAGGEADAPKISLGQAISGTVERIENYGVFVQLDGTKGRAGRGLLPVSEMGTPRGADLRKLFPVGTKVSAKVIGLEEGKMRLSLKAMKDDEERKDFEGFQKQEKKGPEQAASFGTLGDLLRKKTNKR
jgi:small subunit ribosomal protein S1